MGLDQYAYANDNEQNPKFIWRKHAKLQMFMENLYYERANQPAEPFNCVPLELTEQDIKTLEKLVAANDLPQSEGGFFFGHQWQDEAAEEYREQDLEFCQWAQAILATRERVNYSCWW